MVRRPPRSTRTDTLFPYTTLFRSDRAGAEALAKALRGLEAVAWQRAVEGRETVVIRDGKEVERRVAPSDALLKLLIPRGDASGAAGREMTPEKAEAFVLPERSEERRVGKECVRTCRTWGEPDS